MKSLAERHADRIQRKADNAAFSTQTNSPDGLGLAAMRISEAQAAIADLTPNQRERLKAMMPDDGFSDASAEADANAYDGQGNLKTAGVGVVNHLVAPVAAAMAVEGSSTTSQPVGGASGNGGWGTPPEPSLDPSQGNQSGAALAAQGDAQGANSLARGSDAMGDTKPAVSARMSVAELEAIATKEGADLTGASNNDARVAAIEANRNKSA